MTTKPSLFWVDPTEFRALLHRAGSDGTPITAAADTGTGQAHQEPDTKRPGTQRGVSTGPDEGAPDEELTDGPLEDRLAALLAWIRSRVEFDHAFVVDQEGLALVHESAPLELIAASAELSATWDALRNRFDLANDNLLMADLTQGQQLRLFSTTTEWGTLSLGLVVRHLISRTLMEAINEQFQRTLEDTKERDRS